MKTNKRMAPMITHVVAFTFLLYFKNINHNIHIKKYQKDHFILLFHGNLFCISENFSGDGNDNI